MINVTVHTNERWHERFPTFDIVEQWETSTQISLRKVTKFLDPINYNLTLKQKVVKKPVIYYMSKNNLMIFVVSTDAKSIITVWPAVHPRSKVGTDKRNHRNRRIARGVHR